MLLLEFAAQGVRGVSPPGGRVTLRPGYNVVSVDGPALRRLLGALLLPDPRDGEAIPRTAGGPGTGPLRAGLTLIGADRITYRLVRDFGASCQLHRFDPDKRAFAPVAQELSDVAARLRETVGVPSPSRLAALLTLTVAELPSKAAGPASSGASLAGLQTRPRPPATAGEARQRVAALEAELVKAEGAEKLQYQLDGLQSRLFKLEEALRNGQRLREGVAEADGRLAALQPVSAAAAALGDPEAKLAALARATVRRDEARRQAEEERQVLAEAEAHGAPTRPWLDPRVLIAAGAGLACLGLGVAGAVQGTQLRTVALLDLPAFGLAGWLVHAWIDRDAAWGRLARRRRAVEEQAEKAEQQFQHDAAEVAEIVQRLGISKPEELRDHLLRLDAARRDLEERRAALAAWEGDPETAGALSEKGQVEEELRVVENELASEAGGYVRDVRTVESELERARAEAEAPLPAAEPMPDALSLQPPAADGAAATPTEPLHALLAAAAVELGGSAAAAGRAVAAKASQLVAALSGNRFSGVGTDDRGNVQVLVGGRPAPAISQSGLDRDLIYLALKLALMEQAVAADRTVAVVEDVFAGLPEGARRAAGRFLKQAAKAGQILHATADAAIRESADHLA